MSNSSDGATKLRPQRGEGADATLLLTQPYEASSRDSHHRGLRIRFGHRNLAVRKPYRHRFGYDALGAHIRIRSSIFSLVAYELLLKGTTHEGYRE